MGLPHCPISRGETALYRVIDVNHSPRCRGVTSSGKGALHPAAVGLASGRHRLRPRPLCPAQLAPRLRTKGESGVGLAAGPMRGESGLLWRNGQASVKSLAAVKRLGCNARSGCRETGGAREASNRFRRGFCQICRQSGQPARPSGGAGHQKGRGQRRRARRRSGRLVDDDLSRRLLAGGSRHAPAPQRESGCQGVGPAGGFREVSSGSERGRQGADRSLRCRNGAFGQLNHA